LASRWAFHNELRIDYLSCFDITVDLRHSWEYKMRSKLSHVVLTYIGGDSIRSQKCSFTKSLKVSAFADPECLPCNKGKDVTRTFLSQKEQ
jgi:hypothetical protein